MTMSGNPGELIRRVLSLAPEAQTVALLPCADASLAVELAPMCRAVRCVNVGPPPTGRSRMPANVSLVDGEVSSLPLADQDIDMVVIEGPLTPDLASDTAEALLSELERVLSPDGVWLTVSSEVEGELQSNQRGGFMARSSAPETTSGQVEAFFPITYIARSEDLERTSRAASHPGDRGRPQAAGNGLILRVHARVRVSWLDALGLEDRPGRWTISESLEASDDVEWERAALHAEVALLRTELQRPLYRSARSIRDLINRLPLLLRLLRWLWQNAHTLRHRLRSGRHGEAWAPPPDLGDEPSPPPPAGSVRYPLRDQWMVGRHPAGDSGWAAQLTLTLPERSVEASIPTVSIIVLSFNNGALTLDCLRHLWANTEGARYEVIVVDNGSEPDHATPLRPYRRYFRDVSLTINRYFGEGNNIGAEEARGEILVFLNNDAMVSAGWLQPLLRAMAKPNVGAAGARLMFADGRVQETGAALDPDGSAVQFEKGMELADVPADGEAEVDYCSAACLAVRAALFRRVGGFDLCWEPAYYEDTDLCFKIRSLGFDVVCVRDSRVVHLEHATTARRWRNLDLRGQPEFNQGKFLDRWGPVLRGEAELTDYASLSILE